ncbi:kinase-like domain-containing protein [Xylariaceae sp. FL0804]|nr:kinase-like domain-containing protein [Xylariaceae sp. FL0804]
MASKGYVRMCDLVPPRICKGQFLSLGGAGYVFRLTDEIVVQYRRKANAEDLLALENAVYDVLDRAAAPSPHVIQSLFRHPSAIFLPYMAGGSLEDRMARNQVRERGYVTAVLRTEAPQLTARWTAEVCAGVAWLAGLGRAHGDLRPANVLVDAGEHLKLADFDCAAPLGSSPSSSGGGHAPWARLRPEAGDGRGSFGFYGPATEQFAVGSIAYYVTRSHEPYGDPAAPPLPPPGEEDDVTDLMERKVFPALKAAAAEDDDDDVTMDRLIARCWHGHYASLVELCREAQMLVPAAGSDDVVAACLDADRHRVLREECVALVESGLLSWDAKVEKAVR